MKRWRCGECKAVLETSDATFDAVLRAHAETCAGEPTYLGVVRAKPAHIADVIRDVIARRGRA